MGNIYNLFAGPSSGKSATAGYIFGELRKEGYSIELPRPIPLGLSEAIKHWAYRGQKPEGWDQEYIWSNQRYALDYLFRCGVEHIISDAPLVLQCIYAKIYDRPYWYYLFEMSKMFEADHGVLNIFLDRGDIPYEEKGRYENEQEAKLRDEYIISFLNEYNIEYETINLKRTDLVKRAIYRKMEEKWKNSLPK